MQALCSACVATYRQSISPLKKGATAGLSSSAEHESPEKHCWTSQQWHPMGSLMLLSTGCYVPQEVA